MAKNMPLIVLALLALGLTIAPGIVWIILGSEGLNEPCLDLEKTPNLAVWLIVEGSLLLGIACVTMLTLPFKFSDNGMAKTMKFLGFFILALFGMFHFAWLIIGSVRLSQQDEYFPSCESRSYSLYQTTLAAIIMGWISLVCTCIVCFLFY